MNKYRIQKFTTSVIVPINHDTGEAAVASLNGILKGITLVAPALTGSSYILTVLGQRGETLFTKSSIVEAVNTYIGIDANNHPINIPLSLDLASPIRIKSTGTPDATGELTLVGDTSSIADGKLVTIGDIVYRWKNTTAQAYDVKIIPHVAATAILTWDNAINVADGEQVEAGTQTYTYKTALTDGIIANEVLIGSDGDDSLLNLKKAINGEAGGGTKYGSATVVNPDVSCGAVTAHAVTLSAKVAGAAGNSLAKSETSLHLDFDGSGATFTGGSDQGFESLENLKLAIGATGAGNGTDYHAGTLANPYVTATRTNGVITVTAVEGIDAPEDVVTTTNETTLSWGAATLVGGGEAAARTFTVDLLIDRG